LASFGGDELTGEVLAELIAEGTLGPEAARKQLQERGMQLTLARKLRRMLGEELENLSVVGHGRTRASCGTAGASVDRVLRPNFVAGTAGLRSSALPADASMLEWSRLVTTEHFEEAL
jgi:hypothetical protein